MEHWRPRPGFEIANPRDRYLLAARIFTLGLGRAPQGVKLGGREVTAEDGRGAVALRDTARVVLTLNLMSSGEADALCVTEPGLRRLLVRIDTGKANRAPPDATTWIKLEGQSLENGGGTEPADQVGVATPWEKPEGLHGLTPWQVHQIQDRVGAGICRDNAQAKNWVGHLIAEVAGLSLHNDKTRIKSILKILKRTGVLKVVKLADTHGDERPFVVVGDLVHLPQFETCGTVSAESTDGDH